MLNGADRHCAEELLEKYAMGNLEEEQIPPLEEHILMCSNCQVRLADMDDYVTAAREAARTLEVKGAGQKPWKTVFSGQFWHVPKPVWAAGLAAAMAVAVIPFAHRTAPETEVYLSTLRGTETAPVARGKVVLRINTTTLAALPEYGLQVVDSGGAEVWKTRVVSNGNEIAASVPQELKAGRYWVRLYSGDDAAQPLREFALRVD